jgi:hypothetical protein
MMLGGPAGSDRLLNDVPALFRQPNEDAPPVLWIGHTGNESSTFEPIKPIGHRPRGQQACPVERGGRAAEGRPSPPQCPEHIQ